MKSGGESLRSCPSGSGCSVAWLARLTGGQEVESSNLSIPTIFKSSIKPNVLTKHWTSLGSSITSINSTPPLASLGLAPFRNSNMSLRLAKRGNWGLNAPPLSETLRLSETCPKNRLAAVFDDWLGSRGLGQRQAKCRT